jgi:hypothetical protein
MGSVGAKNSPGDEIPMLTAHMIYQPLDGFTERLVRVQTFLYHKCESQFEYS